MIANVITIDFKFVFHHTVFTTSLMVNWIFFPRIEHDDIHVTSNYTLKIVYILVLQLHLISEFDSF